MANSCMVTYKCVGDEKDIASFHDVLKKMQDKKREIKIQRGWVYAPVPLCELVRELGGDANGLKCRGEVTSYCLDEDGGLEIDQETAWCEQEDVRHLIEKVYESMKVYYVAEEPGCDVYLTNDEEGRFFPYRYFLDSAQGNEEYFETIEDAAKYVSNIVGSEVEPTFEAVDAAVESYIIGHEDVFYSFHQFEIYN